jgi:hypothetical protein
MPAMFFNWFSQSINDVSPEPVLSLFNTLGTRHAVFLTEMYYEFQLPEQSRAAGEPLTRFIHDRSVGFVS